jgi:CHASE2 domain-containing sensor protein
MKKRTKLLLKDSILCTLFSFRLIYLLSFIVINISFFNPLKKAVKDFSFLDVYYAENFNSNKQINTDIVLINIEQRNRIEISQLIESIDNANPKVIGLDVIFKDKRESFSDSILADALNKKNVINSYIIEKDSLITNNDFFNNDQKNGFVNFNFDNKTSIVRGFKGIITKDDKVHYSFPVMISKQVLASKFDLNRYSKKLKNELSIKFYGNLNSFIHFDFDELMLLEDRSILKDKIVLLGYIGTPTGNNYDVEDKHFTPLNKITAGKSIPDMFGVVIHANIINMLINNDFIFRVSNFWIGIYTLILSFLGVLFFIWLGEKKLISFLFIKKFGLFLFTILLMWLTFWFFKMGVLFRSAPIIGITLLCCSFINYYKFLIKKIQKKYRWKSYFR